MQHSMGPNPAPEAPPPTMSGLPSAAGERSLPSRIASSSVRWSAYSLMICRGGQKCLRKCMPVHACDFSAVQAGWAGWGWRVRVAGRYE